MKNYTIPCCSALLLLFINVSCKSKMNAAPEQVFGKQSYFTVLSEGAQSNMETKQTRVITNQEELIEIYGALNATITPKLALPEINWKKQAVVAAFTGLKSSGGYSVEVFQVRNQDDERIYKFAEKAPSSGNDVVSMVMTTPYLLLKVDTNGKKITASF